MDQPQTATIRRGLAGDIESITAITAAAYANYVPLLGRKPLE